MQVWIDSASRVAIYLHVEHALIEEVRRGHAAVINVDLLAFFKA